MKTFFLTICFSLIAISSYSQSKIGTIDIDFIILQMPEIEDIQKNLREYGENLDKELNAKMKDYQDKLEEYNNNVDSFTEVQLREKQDAILTLEDEISKFRQNGIQLMRLREDDLKRPLFQKIAKALEEVAAEQKYTQVFNTSSENNLVFLDPDYDLTLPVLAEMGIKVEIED